MNPLKLIKKKNFYSQEKINSIDFQEIEEKGGKLFKKVYKKIKWEKIDYEEITSDTFDDINWEFVNFKKAVKSKTFDIDKIDFEEAELSKTFKFLDKKSSLGSGGTSNSTTSKGGSDSSLYKQFGPYDRNDVIREDSRLPNYRIKSEFNDKYRVNYASWGDDQDVREFSVYRGDFKYDEGGSVVEVNMEEAFIITLNSIANLGTSDCGRSSIRVFDWSSSELSVNQLGIKTNGNGTISEEVEFSCSDFGDDERGPFVVRDRLLSLDLYKKITTSPDYSQFFEDDQWYLQSVEESNFL